MPFRWAICFVWGGGSERVSLLFSMFSVKNYCLSKLSLYHCRMNNEQTNNTMTNAATFIQNQIDSIKVELSTIEMNSDRYYTLKECLVRFNLSLEYLKK